VSNLIEADFVVVGGGSAGCVVAGRLAEAGHDTVLLEAGPPDRNPLIHVPAGVRYLLNDPRTAWLDSTEPNRHAGGRKLAWPHGRVLGGSGSINGMIFIRGDRSDFDQWAQAGNPGWDFDGVLPYFRSMETYRGKAGPHRGTSGPLSVEDRRFRLPITDRFVEAAQAAGYSFREDINVPQPDGVGYAQMNRFGRWRGSSARAFLPRGLKSGKLRIVTGAEATGLIMDGRRCTGVRFTKDGTEQVARAHREVVMSSGAVGSPKLLQLSGIGPAGHLRALGIDVLHDLPGVGRELSDHYGIRCTVRLRNAASVNEKARMPRLAWEIAKFLTTGTGALVTGVTTAMLFCRSREGLSGPDLQLLFTPTSFDQNRFGSLEREPGASISICLSRPKSRGSVMLASADWRQPPAIDANYLSDRDDLDVLVRGFDIARRLFATAPLANHVAAETLPGPDVRGAALEQYVREKGVTIYHPTGTCRMAPGGVVDARLRVHGLQGLRVADASIMPNITSGNTNAASMMIGEKAAAMIAEDARA
jgi:choline dehydrogenase